MLESWQIERKRREEQEESDRRSWSRVVHAPRHMPVAPHPRTPEKTGNDEKVVKVNFEL